MLVFSAPRLLRGGGWNWLEVREGREGKGRRGERTLTIMADGVCVCSCE